MIFYGGWRSDAELNGFDPHPDDLKPPAAHLLAGEGVDVLAAFDAEIKALRHLCAEDDICGERCSDCDERMCATYGPEPRACQMTCADCACSCQACFDQREDMRADLLHRLERDGA